MSFSRDVHKFVVGSMERADRVYRGATVALFNGVIRDTPVDTGRARGNWQTSTQSPITSETDRDDPTPRGQDGGPAQAEVLAKVRGLGETNYLTNNLPYIERLEYGYSKQSPGGMVRRNMALIQQNIKKILRTTR